MGDDLCEEVGGVLDTASSGRREGNAGIPENAASGQTAQYRRRPLRDAGTMDFSPS
ncbi:hypothetical protein GCM10010260_36270 [Streptomyces filipinensis]|uniref:Uncharacterized protein n=1 Tax=Streptomyces filipinensis TaxID=66887 RepID=A0A918IBX2_9ACTN|nr:hypothetical protein GCM10010260_36270 [Streptomyces filipinensis]